MGSPNTTSAARWCPRAPTCWDWSSTWPSWPRGTSERRSGDPSRRRCPGTRTTPNRTIGGHGAMPISVELLGQCDEDALGPADVTEPIAVLVLRHLAKEFGAVGAQAGKDVLDVIDGEHDATYAQRVRRCVFRLSSDRRRQWERAQSQPA